jgi:chromosome segregation ATPase
MIWFQMITLGGSSELDLLITSPFSEGVVFSVRPTKKSWKNISNIHVQIKGIVFVLLSSLLA